MRTFISSLALIASIQLACNGQSVRPWNFEVNSEGAKILSASTQVITPSGTRPGSIAFWLSGKGASCYLSLDFRVGNVLDVKAFHFDDFEGPDSKITKKLMKISLQISGLQSKEFSFCPNGGYVADPKDGFTFGTLERGRKNQLMQILNEASKGNGKLIIEITDSIDSKRCLVATIDLAGSAVLFEKFLNSR